MLPWTRDELDANPAKLLISDYLEQYFNQGITEPKLQNQAVDLSLAIYFNLRILRRIVCVLLTQTKI